MDLNTPRSFERFNIYKTLQALLPSLAFKSKEIRLEVHKSGRGSILHRVRMQLHLGLPNVSEIKETRFKALLCRFSARAIRKPALRSEDCDISIARSRLSWKGRGAGRQSPNIVRGT